MTGGGFARLRRQLEFARHVPPRQIARRFWLAALRRAEARLRPSLDPGPLERAAAAPAPLLAPRETPCRRTPDGWRFEFLGRAVAMGPRIDWSAPADQLWRMNLHYMEYLEALGDEHAGEAIAQWIEANPPYAPGSPAASWSAYALSLRAVVWMQQLAARPALAASAPAAEDSLARQLVYLERHLETDVGGNHLIKNLKALLWGSAFFEGAAADRWRRTGLALLRRELDLQFPADGVHFELSPAYHCQVFADLLEIRHALGTDPLGGALDAALERAAPAVADLTHPDGRIAQFGDAGLHMAYAPTECLDAFARIYGRAPEPRRVFAFRDAGYFGAREGGDCVIVDAGPIAPDRLPAHGHGDALSFEWSLAGSRIVVDQGVFEYVAGEKRHASRTASFHNTLTAGEGDQAEFFGAFRSARRAVVRVLEFRETEGGFLLEAEQDGFRRTAGGPLHRRRFDASPRRIRIEDRLSGAPAGPVRARLLLAPDAEAEALPSGAVRIICGKATALVAGSGPIAIEQARWWPDMGVERPTVRLVMTVPPGSEQAWMELTAEGGAQEERGVEAG